jgi:hypothetical protein
VAKNAPDITVVAQAVAGAIQEHARVVRDNPDDSAHVVRAGEALREAVLEYEVALRETSGWSNPIRHLGRLPMYSSDLVVWSDERSELDQELETRASDLVLTATYRISVNDTEGLLTLVEGRGGARPTSAVNAVRWLFESDGWDLWQYPRNRIGVVGVEVRVEADEKP